VVYERRKGDAVANGKGNVKAFVLINVHAGTSPEVLSSARRIPGVMSANACWGRPDIFVVLEAPNEKVLSDTVLNKLQLIQGVESTDTHLVIE
jgi:DNA-binding Lrp family transcriptional regulator